MGATSSESIAGALFGAVRQAVLALLLGHPDQRFYQRQIVRELGLGSGAVQRELEKLTRAGILTRSVEGRQTYFQANSDCPIFEELRGLIHKTFGVAGVLRTALLSIADRIRVAFIFGSVARARENAASDVDVMIVGDAVSLDEIMPGLSTAQRQLRREVNPSVYRTAEFCRKLAEGHHFVTSVVAGPKTFLVGDDRELERLAQVRMGGAAPVESPRDRRPVRRRRSRSAGVSDSRSRR